MTAGDETAKLGKDLKDDGSTQMDEICLEFVKALDVAGLSWLTQLCNIA